MTRSIWRDHDFALLAAGRTISQFGTAMTTFVIPWLFLQMTGSGTQAGLAFAVGFIPYIIVSVPAGVWADRVNRKTLMVIADSGRLGLLTSIPLTHLVTEGTPLWLLYAVQAGVSALSAIFDAAYGAYLPSIVAPNQLRECSIEYSTSLCFVLSGLESS